MFTVLSFQLDQEAGLAKAECESACTLVSSTCHRRTKAFALAQVVPQNTVPFNMLAEYIKAPSLVEPIEGSGTSVAAAAASAGANREQPRSPQQTWLPSVEIRSGRNTQQARKELNETVSGRIDMLKSINTAVQSVTQRPAPAKPYRISDLIPSRAGRGLSRFRSSSSSSNIRSTGTVTAADMVNLQQQLRHEMAHVVQQARTELNATVNGRSDILNGIAAERACQR